MEIVFVTPKYAPSVGGVETHVQRVATDLQRRGHKVVVLTTQTGDEPVGDLIDGVEVVRMPKVVIGSKIKTWQWLWQQRVTLVDADVVHVHDVGWWLLPVLPLIQKKLFVTFHGWEGEWPIRWQAKLHRWLLSVVAQRTVHIGDWIAQYYWDEPSLVLYGGVDAPIRVTNKTQITNKGKKVIRIVFLGRLTNENAIAEYCKLSKQMLQKKLPFSLSWVGDGPQAKQCKKLGMVTGMVDKPETYVAKADVVWASSYLSILLARSLGKPVWGLWQHQLKRDYLQSLPNKEAMFMADSATSLLEQVVSDSGKQWRTAAISQHFSKNWPPTWHTIATQYEQLWQK